MMRLITIPFVIKYAALPFVVDFLPLLLGVGATDNARAAYSRTILPLIFAERRETQNRFVVKRDSPQNRRTILGWTVVTGDKLSRQIAR